MHDYDISENKVGFMKDLWEAQENYSTMFPDSHYSFEEAWARYDHNEHGAGGICAPQTDNNGDIIELAVKPDPKLYQQMNGAVKKINPDFTL